MILLIAIATAGIVITIGTAIQPAQAFPNDVSPTTGNPHPIAAGVMQTLEALKQEIHIAACHAAEIHTARSELEIHVPGQNDINNLFFSILREEGRFVLSNANRTLELWSGVTVVKQ